MDLSDSARLRAQATADVPVPVPPAAAAPAPAPAAGAWLLALQALALKHPEPETAALAVLSDLSRELACERASLGWRRRQGVRLAALSAGDARTRQSLARHLEAAMEEALEERGVILFPAVPGGPGGLLAAHAALARRNGGLAVATVPVVAGERLLGALLLERPEAFDAATLRRAQDAALFVGPLLEMQHRLHGPLPTRVAQALAPRGERLHGREPRRGRLWWLLLPLALAGAAALPMRDEVVAAARVEGSQQRVIAAPLDGFIASAGVRPGAEVKAGEVLVALQDRDLELQRQRWLAETAQLDKQYREALTQDEPAPIAVARAKLEQAQAQLALAEAELARTRITAPFDGVVISGDLHQSAGLPVQRGQPLLTLAPTLKLKVVAEVDEQDIAKVQRGQAARVLFAAQGQAPVRFTVERVSPVASALEGRNVFEIEGALPPGSDAASPGARPGQRGIARIDVAERRVGEVAWERLGHWVRRWHWRLVG